MPDPNPYESPKVEQPLRPAQIVKRGIGVAMILLLTPVAVIIAAGISCATSIMVAMNAIPASEWFLAWVVFWLLFLVPPTAVLIAMLWWAVVVYRQNSRSPTKNPGQENRG